MNNYFNSLLLFLCIISCSAWAQTPKDKIMSREFLNLVECNNFTTLPVELAKMQNFIKQNYNTEPYYLMSRTRDLYKNARAPESVLNNFEIAISQQHGKVEDISCIEQNGYQFLYNYCSSNNPKLEFSAFILKNQKGNFKILMHSSCSEGAVLPSKSIELYIEPELKKGYFIYALLHNHPLYIDSQSKLLIGGSVVPSINDFSYYTNYIKHRVFKEIWVTNGFSTFKLKFENLDKFSNKY